jgi:lysophospholipase L1-like esterase
VSARRACLLAGLFCTLTACKVQVEAAAPPAAKFKPQIVFLYGDSTMQNMGEARLKAQLPPGSQVSNRGQAGQCATEAVDAFVAAMPSLPAGATVVGLWGINDARRCGTPLAAFIAIISRMQTAVASSGKRFILMTPSPTYAEPENTLLKQYAEQERRLGYRLADFRLWIEDPAVVKNFNFGDEVAVDGTHPTPKIYDWLAPKLAGVIVGK